MTPETKEYPGVPKQVLNCRVIETPLTFGDIQATSKLSPDRVVWADVNFARLYPHPLHVGFYLWAHNFEELDNGLWTHPGHSGEETGYEKGGLSADEAMETARETDLVYLLMAEMMGFDTQWGEMLRGKAGRYRWLVEFGISRDPVEDEELNLWAMMQIPPEIPPTNPTAPAAPGGTDG